jgi:hypothetical protein
MDIKDLKRLAGVRDAPDMGENISHTAQEKADYQRRHNIRPGDPEWFKLWFAQPYLTGENPTPKDK